MYDSCFIQGRRPKLILIVYLEEERMSQGVFRHDRSGSLPVETEYSQWIRHWYVRSNGPPLGRSVYTRIV